MTAEQPPVDVLRTPRAGALVIRGSALRGLGYAVGAALGAITSVFLLRGLGVEDFGRYATVAALLGIVSTLSDAGLIAVGARELSLREPGRSRDELLGTLVGLRLLLSAAAVAAAVVFGVVVGYDRTLIAGIVIGGLGVLLVNTQATMMLPLSVDLRAGRIAAVEVVKNAVTLAAVAVLALAGASLLPYFAVQVLAGLLILAITPKLVGAAAGLRPALRASEARAVLREAAPVGIALALNVLYLRLLVVMVSLQTGEVETGYYGTAFRVVELIVVLPPLLVGVAIPLLAVAGADDLPRLRYALQGLTQVSVTAAVGVALVVSTLAEPALRLLYGEEYVGATEMLQLQIWALAPLAAGSALSLGLLSLRRQRDIALANGVAVVLVLGAGVPLVAAYEGVGAAVAALVAESALFLAILGLLARAEQRVTPAFSFAVRPLVALAAGAATLLLPLPDWVDGVVAGAVFVAVALVVRAFPPEVLEALRKRAPGDRA